MVRFADLGDDDFDAGTDEGDHGGRWLGVGIAGLGLGRDAVEGSVAR